MKRIGNIFEKIIDLENIKQAHYHASKDKSFYKEVREINKNPEPYFMEIQKMLSNKTYSICVDDYKTMEKVDKGKVRVIQKLNYFPHRIIQWALMLQVQDVFFKSLIRNTFSSLPGRGIHDARNRLHRDMQNKEATKYCLKLDVKQFYPSINHEVSSAQIRRKIKDPHVLWLCDVFIKGMPGGAGAPIGSLFSQWQGNLNLSPLDHFVLHDLKIEYYYRYCDDIVMLHSDKDYLHRALVQIKAFLRDNLKLEIKSNYQVFPTLVRGIDFVGYRFFGDYILLRKTTVKNMRKKMTKIKSRCEKGMQLSYSEWCAINSYDGWLKYCNGHNLRNKYIKPLMLYAKKYYNEVIKNETISKGTRYSRKSSKFRSKHRHSICA